MEIGIDLKIAAGIPCSHICETPYKDSVLHNVQSNEELVSVSSWETCVHTEPFLSRPAEGPLCKMPDHEPRLDSFGIKRRW